MGGLVNHPVGHHARAHSRDAGQDVDYLAVSVDVARQSHRSVWKHGPDWHPSL